MARKNHNPGCPCCDCFDVTFTDDYSTFATAEGAYVTDRWVLASGEVLDSGSKPSSGQAFFHTIHIKSGDCDLTWDGITFQFRDDGGTITDGTNASIFIPGSSLAAGWQDASADDGTYITLWVTPGWHAIAIRRERGGAFNNSTSRGSVQVITRDNTAASKSLKVTAVGGELKIKSWRATDATVAVAGGYMYGEISKECLKPAKMPSCTERYFQSQQDYPSNLTASASVDTYEIVRIVDTISYECQYLDTAVESNNPNDAFGVVTAMPDIAGTLQCGTFFGWGSSADIGAGAKNPSPASGFSHTTQIPVSTPSNPYAKPRARILFSLSTVVFGIVGCNQARLQEPVVFVEYQSDSKAPASFSLNESNLANDFFACATAESCADGLSDFSAPKRILNQISAEWDTE